MMNIHNGVHFETAHILNRVSKSKTDGHIKLCCVRIPCNYWNRFEYAWSISHAWLGISQYGILFIVVIKMSFNYFILWYAYIWSIIHLTHYNLNKIVKWYLISFKRILIYDQGYTLWTKRAFMKMNFRLNFNGWSVYTIH